MSASPHPEPAALLAEARDGFNGLASVPGSLVETRLALHRVAEDVLAPARRAATGNEIALRWYPGGVGTPPFDEGSDTRVIRTDGIELVNERGGQTTREPLKGVDVEAAGFLEGWFRFATLVIADLQTAASDELDPGLVQLWPEHFDVATELGSEPAGQRAAFGASPGDEAHDEPYIYVAPWSGAAEGDVWNSPSFAGAELGYADLVAAEDPVGAARDFFARCLAALTG
jgi:hypothetical protein